MRRISFSIVTILLGCLCAFAAPSVQIDESKIRASLKEEKTVVTVPINNTGTESVQATLKLEWLATDERADASVTREIAVPPGTSSVEVPFPLKRPSLWLRLRYTLSPQAANVRSVIPQRGILSFAHIADHAIELHASHAGMARPGHPFSVYAQAIHPVTREVTTDVRWEATFGAGEETTEAARTVVNNEGFIEFIFNIPKDLGDVDGGAIQISAIRGDFKQTVSLGAPIPTRLSGRIQTDKPIYQPGQVIHLRAVVQSGDGHAAPGQKVTLRIDDSDGEHVHTKDLVTSRFGVVHDDWTIPAGASLNQYQLELVTADESEQKIANHAVRISRYELPVFSVSAKPERKAFLPGDPVRVTITGSYLFGKPVPKGQVKIIRSERGQLYPRKTKDRSDEAAVVEGQAGEDGTFTAELNLQSEQKQLAEDNALYKDLSFAAYYTDPQSHRTEQRRFDIRLSQKPIHVYLFGSNEGGDLPATVYVSTSYADGTPAATDVVVRHPGGELKLRTNRYGVGRAAVRPLEGHWKLEAAATDQQGRAGTTKGQYLHASGERIRLHTERTFHRAGQAVTLRITTPPENAADEAILIQAAADTRLVAHRIVKTAGHQGTVTFPYQPEFRQLVTFHAWSARTPRDTGAGPDAYGSRTVIFPDADDLRLSVQSDRNTYRPGDEGSLQLKVKSLDGRPVSAALGLAMVDRAVFERASSDEEIGERSWFRCAFCIDAGETELGGMRLNDFYRMKPSQVVSPEMDLVAEALAARQRSGLASAS